MKKFLLILLLASSAIVSAQTKAKAKAPAANGKLTGNITYLVNRAQGQKPDTGAEVIIFKARPESAHEKDTMLRFIKVNLYRELYAMTKDEADLAKLKEENAETAEKFDKLDRETATYFFRKKKDANSIVLTADATGSFSADLKPGRYQILLRSKNLPGTNSIMEVNGKVYTYTVEVKPNATTTQNHKFSL